MLEVGFLELVVHVFKKLSILSCISSDIHYVWTISYLALHVLYMTDIYVFIFVFLPAATPIHDGMRTPMRDRAWNPYAPMSPARFVF